jgi:molybdopterin-containing oxidoreductase family membrane subunit
VSPDDEPVLATRIGDAALTDRLLSPLWTRSPAYVPLLAVTGAGALGLFALLLYTATAGVGVWGVSVPVVWAFAITNFVWWIGIGHAGTFISAVLLLLEQRWRASINRLAEAMTLFAVVNAGLFPLIHLGRPWFFYWLLPYPSTMGVWPQFRSALPWDAVAVMTYLLVSLVFWYLGLIPDLAAVRDRAPERWRRQVYGLFALGWRGSSRHWNHYRVAYGLLAGLATPLVVSVHSIVSMDFAITQLPGWHSPLFPPYFVAGAVYSGFAMVLTLVIPVRRLFGLHAVITGHHLDKMAKMLLATGWMVTYSYLVEAYVAWYSGDRYERFVHLVDRPTGPYAVLFWITIACNCLTPQLFWWRRARRSPVALWFASLAIQLGMWAERFVLIVTAQHRDFLPSSWRDYTPTWVEGGILAGTVSLFLFLFLLFLRLVPFVPVSELKELGRELAREEAA